MRKIFTFLFALAASVGLSWATTNSITINESSHGSVVASSSSAAAGETITLTATPDEGYQLKSISGVYVPVSETLNATSETVNGNKFQAQATSWNLKGWRVYNPGTANTLTVSSLNGTTLITKIEFTSTWGNLRKNDMLSVSAGTLSFDGNDPSTTVTINGINATSVTISGSGTNGGGTWCISSVKVYYEGTDEEELEISDTENANVKTFTMVESEVTISAEFEPAPDFAGEGTEESPYLITSADDWNLFATRVSEGNTYSGVYFQLTNDIAISTMVGLSDHNFNGTFDGAGHTITATLSSDADCCAPFAYTYGATIKNLHVTGTLTANGTHAGGVVGRNGTESLTLTNVSSSMTIIANATNSNGGLVGYTINATLSGCAFTGKLISEQNRRLGGMVGWKSNTTGSYLTITDCVFDPEEVTSGNSGSKTFAAYGGGTVTFTNCYYTQAISADQGKQMRAITAGEGVLVLNTGSATIYNVSGITSYGTGISYNTVLYGGNGDEIKLNLSGSSNGYEASTGTLSGTENPYTLTMADADCQINKLTPAPTTYTLQLVADPEKGSVAVTNLLGSDIIDNGNGNYTVPENAEVTILATPNEGYEFSGWKVGNTLCDFTECGTALNTLDNPLTFTMTEDVAYKAEFKAAAPTGIDNANANANANAKYLRDGMLLIEKNGKTYNATGAEVR